MSRLRNPPTRYWLVLIAVAFFIGLPTFVTSFQTSLWAQVLIFAIAIMGLNIRSATAASSRLATAPSWPWARTRRRSSSTATR